MSILKSFFKNNKLSLFITFVLLIIQVITTLYIPHLVAELIDVGILSNDFNIIKNIGIQMLIVALLSSVFSIIGCFYSAKLAGELGQFIRQTSYEHVLTLSQNQVNQMSLTSILSRLTNDIDIIQVNAVAFFQLIVPTPIMMIVTLIMTYNIMPILAIIPLAIIVLYFSTLAIVVKKGFVHSEQLQIKFENIIKVVREFFTGTKVIRAFNNQNKEAERLSKSFTSYTNTAIKVNQYFAILTPVAYLLMGLACGLIVYFGGLAAFERTIGVGTITAVGEYIIILITYLMITTMIIINVPRILVSFERLEELNNLKSEISSEVIDSVNNSLDTVLTFDNVSFSYDDTEEAVLKNISFNINKGETLAIIGGTGSGKSTLAKLILRYVNVSSGNIYLNKHSLNSYLIKDLRDKISYVPQKAYLFSGSIKSNLLMGFEQASDREFAKALNLSNSMPFVSLKEDGIDSVVYQGGTNFSGGQRQRLAIARALIKPADLYIFDDSFSALDYKTSYEIRKGLKEAFPDMTSIIIDQRISSVKDADNIIVLSDGEIAGIGKHDYLLNTNEIYQEFAKTQNIIEEVEYEK